MKTKCTAFCGWYWNISPYQRIPKSGYICPRCQAELDRIARERAGIHTRPRMAVPDIRVGRTVCAG